MNLNTNAITEVKYSHNNIELFVHSKFDKILILLRQRLYNSAYGSLFISSLCNDTLRHLRILYHALQFDYIHLDDYI